MRRLTASLALWVMVALLLGACGGTTDATQAAIIEATRSYLASNAQVGDVSIKVQKVEDTYARVLVDPTDDDAESATVFLKQQNGVWQVLTLGTAFDRETYDELQIPPDLRV
ncbi:hypothetical protein F8S13_20975 [Chloroflexia bacterium SDU3-3]|nr:hypothetical protein F8S13_20975 [Chloroflexia bacterium SDU3-3]